MIPMPKKEDKNYGDILDTNKMQVTPDEKWIVVNGQRFKRVCLPSPMEARAARAEEEQLLDELEES